MKVPMIAVTTTVLVFIVIVSRVVLTSDKVGILASAPLASAAVAMILTSATGAGWTEWVEMAPARVPAVEAMPEDKFGFAPTNGEFKGVRTFAEQVKHVAAVNYIFGAAILSEKA